MASKCWVIVPAAGSARRMGAAVPKQYLPLAGRTVIEWSLAPFLERESVAAVVVALAEQDAYWSQTPLARHPKVVTTLGGAERMHSVLAGIEALPASAAADDWVLVHDAARPCLLASDVDRLMEELANDAVGGLLATPLADTLKRADEDGRAAQTVPREKLWRALTPQMFRREVLQRALQSAVTCNVSMTDEAQAVEALGLRPRLVVGDADNIKITWPEDVQRAARILGSRNGT